MTDSAITDRTLDVLDGIEAYLRNCAELGMTEAPCAAAGRVGAAAAPAATPVPVPAPVAEPPAPQDKAGRLAEIAARMAATAICPLQETATNIVPGQGNPDAELVFIGEAPGGDEDRTGLAFVGQAGQLLTQIIEGMGMTRDEVWIGNIVKWRPPGNRTPMPEEIEVCMPYLREQLAVIEPEVIVCLGGTAVKGLLDVQTGITRLRGTWMAFDGIDVMPTFHPAHLLRNDAAKRDVWHDMKAVLGRLGREVPKRG